VSISIGDTEVYTVEEVAELFDITERTVRDMLGRGELKGRKLARRWYITAKAIEERLSPDSQPPEMGTAEAEKWLSANIGPIQEELDRAMHVLDEAEAVDSPYQLASDWEQADFHRLSAILTKLNRAVDALNRFASMD